MSPAPAPQALRSFIAEARACPGRHAADGRALAAYLRGRVEGTHGDAHAARAAWDAAWAGGAEPPAPTPDQACDAALRAVDALWPPGSAKAPRPAVALSADPALSLVNIINRLVWQRNRLSHLLRFGEWDGEYPLPATPEELREYEFGGELCPCDLPGCVAARGGPGGRSTA